MGKREAESSNIREDSKSVREGLELVGFKNRWAAITGMFFIIKVTE